MPIPTVANQNLMTWAAFTQAGYEALVNACCNIGTYKEGVPAKLKSDYTGGNVCGYTGIGIAHSKSTFSVNWAASPSNLIPLVASGTVSTEWNTFLIDAEIDIRSNKIIQAQEVGLVTGLYMQFMAYHLKPISSVRQIYNPDQAETSQFKYVQHTTEVSYQGTKYLTDTDLNGNKVIPAYKLTGINPGNIPDVDDEDIQEIVDKNLGNGGSIKADYILFNSYDNPRFPRFVLS